MNSHFSPPSSEFPNAPARAYVLGVGVSAINPTIAVRIIDSWIREGAHNYVCITGVHGVIESRKDTTLRQIHNAAALVTPDGMPLVFMAHRLGFKDVKRVYGPDLMRHVSALSAARGYRQFYYGGDIGVADRLAATLQQQYAGLEVCGTYCPPFGEISAAEDEAAVAAINASGADIVWIGLSTPKQERWMAAHLDRLNAPVLIGVGAAFDFLAGTKPQAPTWMQRAGFEWLYRLYREPRRLWKRYGRIVPLFIVLAGLQLVRHSFGTHNADETVLTPHSRSSL